jgi:RNA polymerase sigma factor (sigma-70 family)
VEKDAFVTIVRDYRNLIYKVCYSYCADPDSRKDLQQEILLQLWKSIDKFNGSVKLSTWIYRVALNTAIFFYRKHNKHQSGRISIDPEAISMSGFEPDAALHDKLVMLRGFIDNLGSLDKALIILYLDDSKYKEIGDVLGLSETNVATKISRIKKALRDQFNNVKV